MTNSRELDCPDAGALGGKIRAAAGLATTTAGYHTDTTEDQKAA